MISKTVEVINEQGMHMRPAGILAKTASNYKECNITLKINDKDINGKALMQIMSANIKKGNTVEIICDGNGEEDALKEIVGLFENSFGE